MDLLRKNGELWRLPSGIRCLVQTAAIGAELVLVGSDGVTVLRRASAASTAGIENTSEYWRREFMTLRM